MQGRRRVSSTVQNIAAAPLITVTQVSKRFGSTLALDRVSLRLEAGEVVALMGANGAGKSTLVRILSGVYPPDSGEVALSGKPFTAASPKAARRLGIFAVHQSIAEIGVPGLSVAENLTLDRLCAGETNAIVSRRQLRKTATEIAEGIGLAIDLTLPLERLTIAEQQLVAIARAVASNPAVIIFDEPTASLSQQEAERLFGVIDRLRQRQVAVLYISHRLGDLKRVADRIEVLRDGRIVGSFERPVDFGLAVRAMIGRDLQSATVRRDPTDHAAPLLELKGILLRPDAEPFDLAVRSGEVVAITGAVGSGKTSLAEIIYGERPPAGGTMSLNGRPWAPHGPDRAIASGVFLAGENRWRTSLFPSSVPFASIAGTISFPFLRAWFPAGPLTERREREAAERGVRAFGIKCRSIDDRLETLSGGNQQKVVVARWHAEPAQVLLLDEPFQGVDIGARTDIIRALRAGASDRATLVFVSDHEEALEVGDRIVVMDRHRIVEDQDRETIDLLRLLTAAGHDDQDGSRR